MTVGGHAFQNGGYSRLLFKIINTILIGDYNKCLTLSSEKETNSSSINLRIYFFGTVARRNFYDVYLIVKYNSKTCNGLL